MTTTSSGLIICAFVVYFFPYIVAVARKHHNAAAILLLNLFTGWTGLGWIGAMIWAATAVHKPGQASAVVTAGSEAATPDTHVRCPDCRELVRADARKCKHCGAALVPATERLMQPRPDSEWRG